MTTFQRLTSEQMAYRDGGLKVLHDMLSAPEYAEPELQAIYNWCLDQNWEATPDKLEEYGPVVGMAMVLGDLIGKGADMGWVWVDDPDIGWAGPSLKRRGYHLFCHPVPMLTRRLHDRSRVHIESLIRDTIANLDGLVRNGSASRDDA
jgi:hypothetical protein